MAYDNTDVTIDYRNHAISEGAVDCNPIGKIIFDLRSTEGKHSLKTYGGTQPQANGTYIIMDMYDQELKGEKDILK